MASKSSNIVNVSWGDHLDFGEGEGQLETPDKLVRGIARWRDDLNAGKIVWREIRSSSAHFERFRAAGVLEPTPRDDSWDEHRILLDEAHAHGMKVYVYVDMFDEGWPLAPAEVRAVSYHNKYHAKDVAAQSRFTIAHPEFLSVDRSGRTRHYGVMCYAYPEVRDYMLSIYKEVLEGYDWDGLFLCTRSQSKPADFADQFGFNEPIVEEYQRRHHVNILEGDFDLDSWRRLQGEYVTQFLRQVKAYLDTRDIAFAAGIPRGDVFGPPIGNLHLDWRTWVSEGIIDELHIDQNSRVCPSMWLHLWPMHSGYGYIQNYFTGKGMATLEDDVLKNYGPLCQEHRVPLYLARMWHEFDPETHERLSALDGVAGLVFGSFRWDNGPAIERGEWYRL